jgi:Mrp family chromosome partitioning ATPase
MAEPSENCNHDCSKCSQACNDRDPKSFIAPENKGSHVKKVIAVMSGKGGVGKSMVAGLSAVTAREHGYSTAILDGDITGPSIPKMFHLTSMDVAATQDSLIPAQTAAGIKVMSMNLLTDDETQPVVWRSPIITGALKQFWTDVVWGDVDYMFVDMPPGTGDIPLTVFQSLPVDGIIIVTTPQELVSMIVEKAVAMAKLMKMPILGIVENMSYVKCPNCGEKINVFGESHIEEVAAKEGLRVIGRVPIDPALAKAADEGTIEYADTSFLDGIMDVLPKIE